jgi:hypothetical protein
MGWLDAAFQTAVPMLTGVEEGQVQGQLYLDQRQREEEDRRARQAQQALQAQLVQQQLENERTRGAQLAHPMAPWNEHGFDSQAAQMSYEEALARVQHPELYERPESGSQTPWAKAGFTDQAAT